MNRASIFTKIERNLINITRGYRISFLLPFKFHVLLLCTILFHFYYLKKIILITGMYSEVLIEDGSLSERPFAIHAREWLLIRVYPKVLRQMALLSEP